MIDLIKELIDEENMEQFEKGLEQLEKGKTLFKEAFEDIQEVQEYEKQINELEKVSTNLAEANNELIATVEVLNSKINTYENCLSNIYERAIELRDKAWYERIKKSTYQELIDMLKIASTTPTVYKGGLE